MARTCAEEAGSGQPGGDSCFTPINHTVDREGRLAGEAGFASQGTIEQINSPLAKQ